MPPQRPTRAALARVELARAQMVRAFLTWCLASAQLRGAASDRRVAAALSMKAGQKRVHRLFECWYRQAALHAMQTARRRSLEQQIAASQEAVSIASREVTDLRQSLLACASPGFESTTTPQRASRCEQSPPNSADRSPTMAFDDVELRTTLVLLDHLSRIVGDQLSSRSPSIQAADLLSTAAAGRTLCQSDEQAMARGGLGCMGSAGGATALPAEPAAVSAQCVMPQPASITPLAEPAAVSAQCITHCAETAAGASPVAGAAPAATAPSPSKTVEAAWGWESGGWESARMALRSAPTSQPLAPTNASASTSAHAPPWPLAPASAHAPPVALRSAPTACSSLHEYQGHVELAGSGVKSHASHQYQGHVELAGSGVKSHASHQGHVEPDSDAPSRLDDMSASVDLDSSHQCHVESQASHQCHMGLDTGTAQQSWLAAALGAVEEEEERQCQPVTVKAQQLDWLTDVVLQGASTSSSCVTSPRPPPRPSVSPLSHRCHVALPATCVKSPPSHRCHVELVGSGRAEDYTPDVVRSISVKLANKVGVRVDDVEIAISSSFGSAMMSIDVDTSELSHAKTIVTAFRLMTSTDEALEVFPGCVATIRKPHVTLSPDHRPTTPARGAH